MPDFRYRFEYLGPPRPDEDNLVHEGIRNREFPSRVSFEKEIARWNAQQPEIWRYTPLYSLAERADLLRKYFTEADMTMEPKEFLAEVALRITDDVGLGVSRWGFDPELESSVEYLSRQKLTTETQGNPPDRFGLDGVILAARIWLGRVQSDRKALNE